MVLSRPGTDAAEHATGRDAQADTRNSLMVLSREGINIWCSGQPLVPQQRPVGWYPDMVAVGENYLDPLRRAVLHGDREAARILAGLLDVLLGHTPGYRSEYEVSRSTAAHRYRMEVLPLACRQGAVISFQEVSRHPVAGGDSANPTGQTQGPASRLDGTAVQHLAADVFTRSSDAILILDADRRIVLVNDAFTAITGYARADIQGRDVSCIRSNTTLEALDGTIWQALEGMGRWQGEVINRRKNGNEYTAWETIDAVSDERGRVKKYVCHSSDITPLKESHNQLHYLAHHDPLTGLANRLLFQARFEQSLAHARRHAKRIGLFYLDINDFKEINDRYGHCVGDRVLKEIAGRLADLVRDEDTVARLGGDEFGIVMEEIGDPKDAEALLAKIRSAIREPMEIDGRQMQPDASIGYSLFPDQGETLDSLLQAADDSMYLIKRGEIQRGHP